MFVLAVKISDVLKDCRLSEKNYIGDAEYDISVEITVQCFVISGDRQG